MIYSSYFKIYFCSCSKELSRFDYLSFLAPESHFRVSRSLCTFLISCCSIFKDHRLFAACFMRLIYYITFPCVCQGVLQKFFKFFLKLFRFAVLGFARLRPLYYITFSSVCQEVFQKFFKFFQTAWLAASLDATCILYHTFSRLSRGFSKVFRKFFASCSQVFREALSLTAHIL